MILTNFISRITSTWLRDVPLVEDPESINERNILRSLHHRVLVCSTVAPLRCSSSRGASWIMSRRKTEANDRFTVALHVSEIFLSRPQLRTRHPQDYSASSCCTKCCCFAFLRFSLSHTRSVCKRLIPNAIVNWSVLYAVRPDDRDYWEKKMQKIQFRQHVLLLNFSHQPGASNNFV